MSRLPFLKLSSEVEDIVYMTWMVPVQACAPFLPAGTPLMQHHGLTPFTILSYRHQHFGPALLGPWRRCCPSPLQSNWRLYLASSSGLPASGQTVFFLKNIMDSLPYTLATRLFSDALPTHLPQHFSHQREPARIVTSIQSGSGSAPLLDADISLSADKELNPVFASVWGSWHEAVRWITQQEAAISYLPQEHLLAYAEIELGIESADILPAQALQPVDCPLLQALQPVSGPLCFVVRKASFAALSEQTLPADIWAQD